MLSLVAVRSKVFQCIPGIIIAIMERPCFSVQERREQSFNIHVMTSRKRINMSWSQKYEAGERKN